MRKTRFPVPAAIKLAAALFSLTLGFLQPPKITAAEAPIPVWLIGNGFHSSLILRGKDAPFFTEISSVSLADEVIIGWGSADVYRGKSDSFSLAKAIFWPGASVLHVAPIHGTISQQFPHSDIVELQLSGIQFRALLQQIDAAFARDSHGRRLLVCTGFLPGSCFYAGVERFYFPKMCNFWIAQKLRASGLPIFAARAITADALIKQAQKLGRRKQRRRGTKEYF